MSFMNVTAEFERPQGLDSMAAPPPQFGAPNSNAPPPPKPDRASCFSMITSMFKRKSSANNSDHPIALDAYTNKSNNKQSNFVPGDLPSVYSPPVLSQEPDNRNQNQQQQQQQYQQPSFAMDATSMAFSGSAPSTSFMPSPSPLMQQPQFMPPSNPGFISKLSMESTKLSAIDSPKMFLSPISAQVQRPSNAQHASPKQAKISPKPIPPKFDLNLNGNAEDEEEQEEIIEDEEMESPNVGQPDRKKKKRRKKVKKRRKVKKKVRVKKKRKDFKSKTIAEIDEELEELEKMTLQPTSGRMVSL